MRGEGAVKEMAVTSRADKADGTSGFSRRSVFAGLFAAAAIGKAEASPDPHKKVESDAAALAASMRALHGGEWRVMVDHELRYAAVSRLA